MEPQLLSFFFCFFLGEVSLPFVTSQRAADLSEPDIFYKDKDKIICLNYSEKFLSVFCKKKKRIQNIAVTVTNQLFVRVRFQCRCGRRTSRRPSLLRTAGVLNPSHGSEAALLRALSGQGAWPGDSSAAARLFRFFVDLLCNLAAIVCVCVCVL